MGPLPDGWNAIVAGLPGASFLQTREWATVKAATGWDALPQIWRDATGKPVAAALVLRRQVRLGGLAAKLCVMYVPRGPLLDWQDASLRSRVLADLQSLAKKSGAIFLKMDPEVNLGSGLPGEDSASENRDGLSIQSELIRDKWLFSQDQIQFRNTVLLDLDCSEADWLARMKQKTRYNLRLSQRKGVRVRIGGEADFKSLYQMYAETSIRDGFVIRPESYYFSVWKTFMDQGMCQPLIAEVDGESIAALLLFTFARRAWYVYGMSREIQRDKMPNYLLQWEAMRAAKAAGALQYDLWGAPERFDENDSMWGVYRFKEGLGGEVLRGLGAWDFPSRPLVYSLYTRILPRLLDGMRRRGLERTRQGVSI